jgi:predicted transcriptional regulator
MIETQSTTGSLTTTTTTTPSKATTSTILNPFSARESSQKDRRSKLEIYLDVLKAIGAGAEKPTHVMYKANLSWVVLRGCLQNLKDQGLVDESNVDDGRTVYHLTNKGFELLNQFLSIREELSFMTTSMK